VNTPNFQLEPAADNVALLRVASDSHPHLGTTAVADFRRAVAEIEKNTDIRAVILTGGQRHFCSGAPRETLLGPNPAEAVAELMCELPRLLLSIPVATISAMTGHAVGGGWMFGLWSDVLILAAESLYSANFLALGITPGMGSTVLLPELLGAPLAREVLLTGRTMLGRELRDAQVPLSHAVRPRDDVMKHAHQLAQDMAALPPQASRMTKQHLASRRRVTLDAALEIECAMHRTIFDAPQTRQTIAESYATPPGSLGETR